MLSYHNDGLLSSSFFSLIVDSSVGGHSVCCRFGSRDPGCESFIQQRKTNRLLSIRKSLVCARASKLTTNLMLWYRQANFDSKGDKLSSSAECRIRTWKFQDTYSPADWMPTHKPTGLSRIKLKTWTQQPVLMMSEHSDHLTTLLFSFRTWLWRYTCLLLLISMLWHRQTIFESKVDKLSSSAECRIRTWKSQDTYSPADWMPTHKPTELSRIKLKTWTQLWWVSIQPTWLHCRSAFAPGSGDIHVCCC